MDNVMSPQRTPNATIPRQVPEQCKPLPNTTLTAMGLAQLRRVRQYGSSTPVPLPYDKIDKVAGYLPIKFHDEGYEETHIAGARLPDERAFIVIMQHQGELWDRLISIYPSRERQSGRKLLRQDLIDAIGYLLAEGSQSTARDMNRLGDFRTPTVFLG